MRPTERKRDRTTENGALRRRALSRTGLFGTVFVAFVSRDSSVDDLPNALLPRRLEKVVALHQVAAQTDVLREAAPAEVAAEVPAAAALISQVLRQARFHLVTPAALRTL